MFEANYCSFCGKHRTEVAKLVSGPKAVGICNECYATMRALMPEPVPLSEEEKAALNKSLGQLLEGVPGS